MPFQQTTIPGLMLFDPNVFEDDRGYFFESFNRNTFEQAGIDLEWVQDNQSQSVKGVIRGLHYQLEPWSQAKLVRVFSGSVYDIALDIRQDSPTFGQHYGCLLSAENKRQLYIPAGFAHGFAVLSERAEFFYKCSNYYSKEHERSIRFDDPALGIDWQLGETAPIVSQKDREAPQFSDAEFNFAFAR